MPNHEQSLSGGNTLTPIFKGKGSAMECNNYVGFKVMCHGRKLYERVMENRLRETADISSRQYGFQPGKSTIEPTCTLWITQEKYLEKQKELHLVFVDLEKAYNRVTRELIWRRHTTE